LKEEERAPEGAATQGQEALMRTGVNGGFLKAALRGVGALVWMIACSSSTTGTGSPSGSTSPVQKHDLASLQGDWTLVSLHEPGGEITQAPRGRFTAGFGEDGDLFIQADCNVCSAGFAARADGSLEVIGPIPCTLAYCSTAPLDTRFLVLLESAEGWSLVDGTLELSSPGGILLFEHATA
jgi:heat shock protein HslJ